MKTTAKSILLTMIILSIGFLSSCSDDDPTDVVQWDLSIHNNTDVTYDIYQDTDLVGHQFNIICQVGAQQNHTLNSLLISVNYSFRLVPDGQDLADYDYETTISSNGSNQTWAVP